MIGAIAADEFKEYADEDLFDSKYLWGPVALAIVVGILLLFVGLCGIGGLCCKNKCMLKAVSGVMDFEFIHSLVQ